MAGARSASGLRRYAAQAAMRGRRASARQRVLPDFVIIGAQKAGTTSLFNYLSAHPGVRPAARKEVHFFDLHYDLGEDWYRAMFPLSRSMTAGGQRLITGEASPYYLFHPLAAERAVRHVPAARLIVLLRDPVDRAWSHYLHEVAAGRETLSFSDALDAEPARLAGAEEAIRAGSPTAPIENHRYFSYFSRGRYADQIRGWLRHYPREAFLFLDAGVLFGDPHRAWVDTTEFLGIDPKIAPPFAVHNPGAGTPLDPPLRARLRAEFREPDHDLEELLGMSFSWTSDL